MGACCLSLCHIDLAMKMTPVTPASPTNVTSGFIVMAMGQHLRLEELIWEPDVPKSAGDYWRSPWISKKICVAIIRCFRRSLRMFTQPFPPNRLKQVLGILSWFDSVWLQQVGKQTSLDTYGLTGSGYVGPNSSFRVTNPPAARAEVHCWPPGTFLLRLLAWNLGLPVGKSQHGWPNNKMQQTYVYYIHIYNKI